MHVLHGLAGIAVILLIGWALSERRSAVAWQTVAVGIGLQLALAILVLWIPLGQSLFDAIGRGFVTLIGFTAAGAQFVFGPLADGERLGFVFAFQVLPTIIFFAALMACLYHLGVMQKIV